MRCPACGAENPERAKFCMDCGARPAQVCPECGTELPEGAKFCFECGARVGAPPEPSEGLTAEDAKAERLKRLVPQAFAERLLATRGEVQRERRMVTILFSDVKGSTAMGEALDPEDVMEIMDGAFDVLIEPVYRYEGTLARLMGDAILAFFGAPIAHEDDPERACRAALEIVEGAQAYAERLARERGIEGFNVRVGINTGLVVVGEVGSDLRVEYTAMGDAINLAARMEGAAEPGTVLITEDTHRLIAPLFETKPLGPIAVKGKAEPVAVHRVLAARAVRGKVRGIAGLESPLVGREAEFGALEEALERLRAGVGGVVTVVGEAGLGKSRLVAETRSQVLGPTSEVEADLTSDRRPRTSDSGPRTVAWVEGRCLSYGSSIAYLLWLDVLRGLLGVSLEDAPEAVGHTLCQRVRDLCPEPFDDVYPYLASLLSLPLEERHKELLDQLDGLQLRERTFVAVDTVVRCSAEREPLVLILEDLHWADSTSLALLEQVLPLIDRAPLLVVAIFRPRKEHGSWRLRQTAAEQFADHHLDLLLNPLAPSDSETLVANLLRVEGLPPDLRERILHRAEGNPFYLEEVIRSLIDSDAIVHDDVTGRWTATREVPDIPIPETLQGVLMARIDRLQEDTKRVLQMASVIGRIFLHRVLAVIAEEERRLDDRLATLRREEMIRERARLPELAYIFKHELTREAAYNGLLKKERRVFHQQVAQALERLLPDRAEEQLGLLAYHWERAGDAEKATAYLLRAGDRARTLYAHEEAIDFYERALVFLRQGEDQDRAARTLMKLGLTHHTAFEYRRSREAYEEGFALLQRAAQEAPAAALPPAPHALRLNAAAHLTLDPGVSHWGDQVVRPQLFRGLVELGPQLEVLPGLARGWEILEGGRRYVLHLQDGARWSDGARVTAYDAEFAWERVLNPVTGAPHANLLYDVKGAEAYHRGKVSDPDTVGVRAPDDTTLLVDLENPTGYFLQLLNQEVTFPVPRHAVEAHGEAWAEPGTIVTNGPFAVAQHRPGECLVLERNARYGRGRAGNLERVEIALLPATAWQDRLALYEADELDVLDITAFPPEARARLRQRYADHFLSAPELTTVTFKLNVNRPPLDDARVRRALTLATDSEVLAGVNYYSSLPATGGFVPPGMPGHSPDIGLPYDPERARRLLAQAGYPGSHGMPALQGLKFSGLSGYAAHSLEIQWQRELGVEIRWDGVPVPEYQDRVQQEQPHLSIFIWSADYPDPDNFLRVGFGGERTGWRNDEYDRLVGKARRLMDQEERMALYRRADQIMVEEAPLLASGYGQSQVLVKPWVKGYSQSAMGGWSPWKDVVIEEH